MAIIVLYSVVWLLYLFEISCMVIYLCFESLVLFCESLKLCLYQASY